LCHRQALGRIRVTLLYTPIKSLMAVLGMVLSAHGAFAQHIADASMAGGPVRADAVAAPGVEVIRLRSGQLPDVALSGDILFRILVAEIAAQRGQPGMAGQTMLDLVRNVPDPRLAQRALAFYLEEGHLTGALAAARYWSRLSPDDAEAQATTLALTAATGQTRGLAAALRQRIEAATDKTAAFAQVLMVLGRLQDRSQALIILDQALSPEMRKLPQARIALADVAQAIGDGERAVVEARMALAVQPDSEDAAQRLLDYGVNVDPERAIADARTFAARYPDARRLRLMLIRVLADRGRHDEALAELHAMSHRAPEDFDLLAMQAQVNYQAGRLEIAQALLHQYVAVQTQRRDAVMPEASDAGIALADAYLLLARIAERQGRTDEAVIALGRIDDPDMFHGVRLRQARLLAVQGRYDEALAMARSASPQDDEDTLRGILAVAQILRDAERLDEALAELRAADADYPDTVEVKYDLAMLYERQGSLGDFERLMREVMTLAPDHAHAYNALGYTLADRNIRLSEAKALILRAHELLPDDPYIMDSLGWVYFRMGLNDLALRYLQQAYDARPEAEIAAHLGEAFWRAGQRAEARQRWREGMRIDADNPTLRETLRRLGVAL